jgi:hypothetical protein
LRSVDTPLWLNSINQSLRIYCVKIDLLTICVVPSFLFVCLTIFQAVLGLGWQLVCIGLTSWVYIDVMRWGCQSMCVLYVQCFLPIIRNGCLFNACVITQGKFGDVTCQPYLTNLGAFSHMFCMCTIPQSQLAVGRLLCVLRTKRVKELQRESWFCSTYFRTEAVELILTNFCTGKSYRRWWSELRLADCRRLIICNLRKAQFFFYVSQKRLRFTMYVCT